MKDEPQFTPKTCCECNKEFQPSPRTGVRTATRPKWRDTPHGEHVRYVVGDLCETCMKKKAAQ